MVDTTVDNVEEPQVLEAPEVASEELPSAEEGVLSSDLPTATDNAGQSENGQAIMVPLGDTNEYDNSTTTGTLSVGDEGLAGPVSPTKTKPEAKSTDYRTKRNLLLILLVLVLALAGAAVAAILVIGDKGGSPNPSNGPETPNPPPVITGPPVVVPAPPTQAPVSTAPATPTASPTDATVATMSPTSDLTTKLWVDYYSSFSEASAFEDATSAQSRAIQWLLESDDLVDPEQPALFEQRYALVAMRMALGGDFALAMVDECRWVGVTCENQSVLSINFARSNLKGYIPDEISMLSDLVTVDLGENEIGGEIPESLYTLTKLQRLYMHQNRLTGEISESIGDLHNLTALYLGQNELSGPFPTSLSSVNGAGRPLRYLVLNHNNLNGPLPSNLRWRAMYYLDVSHNNFSGPLPDDFGGRLGGVRYMYLNNNEFSGSIPDGLMTIAGGRLEVLYLNDNKFTGRAPPANSMTLAMYLQNNKFDVELDKDVCKLEVLSGNGEMVALKADCSICSCSYNCGHCRR